ncbi:MAG: hypothetical protein DRI81_01275 [Chloroflexi bacterium]|nr:MAG: hypothetical protein DRI81_01275 [Chloroflexota bacterium]
MDNDASHSQKAEGHHIAQASDGSTAIVIGRDVIVYEGTKPISVVGHATDSIRGRKDDAVIQQPSFDPLDSQKYAKYMLNAFVEWRERYTPLSAEYREFELYIVSMSSPGAQRIPVLQVPDLAPAVVLLGESGAGKTTALWRMIVDLSEQLTQFEHGHLPVLVRLRDWSPACSVRQLVQNQFAIAGASYDTVEEELISGNCLVLVDGLNELPHRYDQEDAARRDLQNFFHRYSENQYIFTCRTHHYDPEFLTSKPEHPLPCFEIQRLDRGRVKDYVQRYFKNDVASADDLLEQLELSNDHKWGEQASFVHLARIPLHLQMIILEYQRTGEIPPNKAKMLRKFASHMVKRDRVRQAARVGLDPKQRVLGQLAYRSLKAGYYLSLPESLAKTIVGDAVQNLRAEGGISSDIPVDTVWQEVLSNNFLSVYRNGGRRQSAPAAEWLHQVLFDYFLACEIIRVLIIPGTKEAFTMRQKLDVVGIWDQPCQIALGLVDSQQGATFLEILVRTAPDLARRSFTGQSEEDAADLSDAIVSQYTQDDKWDEETLARVSLELSYVPIVDSLINAFRACQEYKRQSIAKIVSCIAREHYGSPGAERFQDILESWIANRNELIKFYSAVGLWERNRGRAAGVLRKLHKRGSPEVRGVVNDLADEWSLR